MLFAEESHVEDELLDEESEVFLDDVFQMTPEANITIEDKFARLRKHVHTQHRGVSASTIAANHSLSEFNSMFHTAKARFTH